MLIRFEVANYRSVRETAELSMVAIDRDREEARHAPLLGESLVPVAAVFGPNASGKSNVLAAFSWLRDAVLHSLRFWEDEIPVEPFAFGSGPASPSEFVLELTIGDVRFEYVLELGREKVVYEGLFHYPEKKRRRIFEREESELKIQRGLGVLSGTRELLTPRTLAISVAHRFDEPLVSDFVREIRRIQILGNVSGFFGRGGARRMARAPFTLTPTLRWFEEDGDQLSFFPDEGREQALALLRLADLGIEDVMVDVQEVASLDSSEVHRRRRVRLVHKTDQESAAFDFNSESEGTRTWFQLIGPVLTALRQGSLVLFDELDASLHPTLSAELLRLFHSPVINPRGAQLVFTSHDTSLLNHLNRDEVWLTEKRPDGSTRLGALADFAGERVRKSQNLENAYLHGRFGALPQVDQTEFLRALGLIG
ncbi:ATP-binding protein [Actinocorallia aurantiaca]|uniref:ATP-binding protein n=1 Tax=Actinocorallia aurantiaca TaxID=46204 RepID=A0ABN3U4I9_9ACTN